MAAATAAATAGGLPLNAQFSDDSGWLRDWLQDHNTPFCSSSKSKARHPPRGGGRDDVGGGRLFLSGESGSSQARSPGNAFHFRLHLSSYDNSTCQKSLTSVQVRAESEPVEFDGARHRGVGDVLLSNPIDTESKPVEFAEIDDAVELSIAASEALVIHGLVESDCDLRHLPMAAVVEMALCVKQARLEGLKHWLPGTIGCSDEGCCNAELYDKLTHVSESPCERDDHRGTCDLDVSRVKETPVFHDKDSCGNGYESVNGDFGNFSASNQSDHALCWNSGRTKDSPSEANNYLKEVDEAARLKQHNSSKSIAKPFLVETSFLSESDDVVMDENSVVQVQESGKVDIASQSKPPFGGSCEKHDQGLFSQGVATFLTQSSADPLCSIVPCSLSVEEPHLVQAEGQHVEDSDPDKYGSPTSGPQFEKLSTMSDPEIPCYHQTVHCPRADECCETKVYSTPLPNSSIGLRNGQLKSSILSLQESNTVVKIQTSTKSPLGMKATGLSPGLQLNQQNHGSDVSESACEKSKNKKSEPIRAVSKGLPPLPMKRPIPLLFNCMKRRRIEASRYLANDSSLKDGQSVEPAAAANIQGNSVFQKPQLQDCENHNPIVHKAPRAKTVRFAEDTMSQPVKKSTCSTLQKFKRFTYCKQQLFPQYERAHFLPKISRARKNFIFLGMEFLVTGFSGHKEKEIEGIIQRHGGVILFEIPSSSIRKKKRSKLQPDQPIVIASKKLKTTKFFYGCAAMSPILDVSWLTDSISAGSVQPPEKYAVLSYQMDAAAFKKSRKTYQLSNNKHLFEGTGIMLHGKSSFYPQFAKIIKHGGGQAFKTLQQLLESLDNKRVSVGIIAIEFDSTIMSRHLRYCALEKNVPIMPASWIEQSLYSGKLLPVETCSSLTSS